MKIAILGTRGIPNLYGGFEQFAKHLALGLKKYGFDITVYSPHNHTNKNPLWKGIRIIHIFDPEYLIGTAGQFRSEERRVGKECRSRWSPYH